MDSSRNIICAGSLYQQSNSGALVGLLLRLKDLSHGTYLVLCLHNKIPILEWYRNVKKSNSHEPNALQDLIDGKAVAVDFNTFAICFDNDRDPLRFMAENQKQRDNWISAINSVRIEHTNLLDVDEQPTIQNENVSNEYCRITPEAIPIEESHEDSSVDFRQEVSSPINCLDTFDSLGLPPTVKSFASTSYQRESGLGLSTSNSDESNFRLSKELNLSVASSPSFSNISSPFSSQSRARSSTMTHFQFDSHSAANNNNKLVHQNSTKENQGPESPAIKRASRKSSCLNAPVNGLSKPLSSLVGRQKDEKTLPITTVTLCEAKKEESDGSDTNENDIYTDGYYHVKSVNGNIGNDYYRVPISPNTNLQPKSQKEPQRLSLTMAICTENLKIIRMSNRFWIVGWELRCHKAVNKLLHFGDEILEVNGDSVASINDINKLFYASPVGVPIQLLIRSIPYGEVKTLRKSIRISQKVGIVLFEGKNKIESIEHGTLAGNGKIPTEIPSFNDPTQSVMPSITEINNKPLNPFSVNEEPYARIGEVPNGQPFEIILHPSDFVHLLKAEMKVSGYI